MDFGEVVLTEPSQPPSLSNAPRLISPPCYEYDKQQDVSLPTLQILNQFLLAFSVRLRPRFFWQPNDILLTRKGKAWLI